jgi:hypothetical protein
MNTENLTVISLVIAGLTLVFTALGTYFNYIQTRNIKQRVFKEFLLRIKKYDRIIMFVSIILLSGVLIWQLSSATTKIVPKPTPSKTPLLVFAGGGSVRNYLQEVYSLDVRKQPNSVNIAIASGSAWRVLSEEYQLNGESADNDSLNKFITICLSAGKMSEDFYFEYMSNMKNTIIGEVYLGEDKLVSYISKELRDYWRMSDSKTILSDTLAYKIQEIIASNQEIKTTDNELKKVRIFTTNKMSGTLESYKKNLPDFVNFEEMMDNKMISIYYDNMDPENVNTYVLDDNKYNREYLILGSQYYKVNKLECEGLELLNKNGKKIQKPMYLYFLATKVSPNQYRINEGVLEFLKVIGDSGKLPIKEPNKWNKMIQSGFIFYDMTNSPFINMEQINWNK